MNRKLCTALAAAILLACVSNLPAAETAWTSITVEKMHCGGCAQKIAARLYAVRGVQEVRVDVEKKTLFVAPQQSVAPSPKALWEAVEKAKDVPLQIVGPSGTFTEKPKS